MIAGGATHLLTKRIDHTQRLDICAHCYGHQLGPTAQELVGELREGIVELRADLGLVVAGESPVANVADDADNREGAIIHVGHPEKFADGVLSGEGALGEDIVDDDDELAVRRGLDR